MFRSNLLMAASLASLLALSSGANAQSPAQAGPHMIVVKLVERGGPLPYAFEPASVVAQHGDTVRFIEAAAVMHNVRFTKHARGAKLGAAESGPYLTTKGQTYDLVIDQRFTDGAYEYVCDPHAAIGMKGTLVVGSGVAAK
jgi:plastocyanin